MIFNSDNFPMYEAFVPKHLRDKWEDQLPGALWFEFKGYFVVMWAALFIEKRLRFDKVKRLGATLEMPREYLIEKYDNYNTHDNAVDEYFWGMFAKEGEYGYNWTIKQYESSKWKRYYMRVRWLWRNMGYTYAYEVLGVPKEDKPIDVYEDGTEDSGERWIKIQLFKNYFQYEMQLPDGKGGYYSYNFGWKPHKSAPVIEETGLINVLYGNRVRDLSATKYKNE